MEPEEPFLTCIYDCEVRQNEPDVSQPTRNLELDDLERQGLVDTEMKYSSNSFTKTLLISPLIHKRTYYPLAVLDQRN